MLKVGIIFHSFQMECEPENAPAIQKIYLQNKGGIFMYLDFVNIIELNN